MSNIVQADMTRVVDFNGLVNFLIRSLGTLIEATPGSPLRQPWSLGVLGIKVFQREDGLFDVTACGQMNLSAEGGEEAYKTFLADLARTELANQLMIEVNRVERAAKELSNKEAVV